MNENILKRLHEKESREGIVRLSPEDGVAKAAKIVYIISSVLTLILNIFYIASAHINRELALLNEANAGYVKAEDDIIAIQNSIIFVSLAAVLMAVGFILFLCKLHWPSLILSSVPSVLLCIHYAQRMAHSVSISDTVFNASYFWDYVLRFFIPLAAILISSAVYCIISIRFNRQEKKAYNDLVNRLYSEYADRFYNLTDEEWEKFLSEYEPPAKEKLKRSQKQKIKKEKQE